MTILAILTVALAIYGLLALLFQAFHKVETGPVARFGGVVHASTDRTLGYLPPELQNIERRVLAARATT